MRALIAIALIVLIFSFQGQAQTDSDDPSKKIIIIDSAGQFAYWTNQTVKVLVEFVVEKDGSVRDAKVIKSGGQYLDDAALEGVKAAHHAPAMNNGVPVRLKKIIPIVFKPDTTNQSVTNESKSEDILSTYKYSKIDQPEKFKGDIDNFIARHLNYPLYEKEHGIEGKVFVGFIIEADGTVSNVKILKGVGGEMDKEAIRVVKLTSGKWKPGKNNGQPVRLKKVLPIYYRQAK